MVINYKLVDVRVESANKVQLQWLLLRDAQGSSLGSLRRL